MMDNTPTILAIESAISGGSLSLMRGDAELRNWVGDASNVMKAENLLVNIDRILHQSAINIRDIDLIAVSAGPGSFTGIRIGMATALGLKMGLSIEIASVSALESAVFKLAREKSNVAAAMPVGRNAVCIQQFEAGVAVEEAKTISEEEFYRLVSEFNGHMVVHADLYGKLQPADHITNAGSNIARSIGEYCFHHREVDTPPMFIAKSF